MKYFRLYVLFVLAFVIGLLSACNSETFSGGVAVEAVQALAETPTAGVGIPGVPDAGSASNEDSFVGVTDGNGIDQHPTASTNVTWDVTADISAVIFSCPSASRTGYVPSDGAVFTFTCLL